MIIKQGVWMNKMIGLNLERVKWIYGELRWLVIRFLHVITKRYYTDNTKYGNCELHSPQSGNDKLFELIVDNQPFAFCRFSFVEYDLMIRCKTQNYFGIKTYKNKKNIVNSFKIDEKNKYLGIELFNTIMLEALDDADMLGVWRNIPMGDTYFDTVKDKEKKYLVHATAVEPYGFEFPWSKALQGKKVLVVSPFSKEIKQQYQIRELLWDNKDILPQFELITVNSVWYFANSRDERFSNWFEALDYLYSEIMKEDFDIALLGCGAFGFPLAARIKKAGKQAVHMGGALQILFGIKGKRWDNTNVSSFYNESWIRPGEDSKPADSDKLDQSCYW